MYKIIFIFYILTLLAKLGGDTYKHMEYQKYAPLRDDYEQIAMADYNAIFLSTFPIDHYAENVYESYYGIDLLKTSYCISDTETLNEYFIELSNSQKNVETVYLGIRPDIISADDLLNLVDTWNDKQFEIIIAYPSLEYWKELDEDVYPVMLDNYMDFVTTLMLHCEKNEQLQKNLSLYFYNSTEWLVGNNANYDTNTNFDSAFNVNDGIAQLLITYSNSEHKYQLTLENYNEMLENFETLTNSSRYGQKSVYPDLSQWDVVFFGDSVIAFPTTNSIPGAFSGFTGAHTYNCGRGGSSASVIGGAFPGIPEVVDAFLMEDLSLFDEDSQIYSGMADYFENADENRQKCFVISFGLNDYFNGCLVRNNDPYDIQTYTGALRTAIEKLQDAYPDALIILMTPNFISLFENGLQSFSDAGVPLPDYVAAVISICHEKNLYFYDSYNLLGIDGNNHSEYLMDGCHPNESTRYAMAQGLAEMMAAVIAERK